MANFHIFVTMATRVGVIQILFCTVKFADPENPMFCARIGDISPVQAKL